LIAVLSAAKPKIADYTLTTLIPNLGVVRRDTGDGTVFADIPGLIEGAHQGQVLGHDFLRHIERTRLLLHLVDATAADPIADYQTIQAELQAYGRGLPDRRQILALNKIDAADPEGLELLTHQLQQQVRCHGAGDGLVAAVLQISAATQQGLDRLLQAICQQLDELTAQADINANALDAATSHAAAGNDELHIANEHC
jgi:GTP-binding protein